MKNSPLTTIVMVLLVVSVLASVALCWTYISNTRELRKLQNDAAMISNNRTVVNALATEVLEYSKKNPAVDPILEAAGVRPRTNAAPTSTKPAGK